MSDEIKVGCPYCGGHIAFSEAEYGGKVIPCPHCQKKTRLPSQGAQNTLGFRVVGLIILLFCCWMWYLTLDKYHNGELVVATAKYFYFLRTNMPDSPEIAQIQKQMDMLHWKGFFIEKCWWFGICAGFTQLFVGRHFENLPWGKIFLAWLAAFIIGLIQNL